MISRLARTSGASQRPPPVSRSGSRFLESRSFIRTMIRLSNLGTFSMVWFAIGAMCFMTGSLDVRRAWILFAAIASEYALTNGLVKRLFVRPRPRMTNDFRETLQSLGLVMPRTSSFPSGHASASAMSVTILLEAGGVGLFVSVVLAVGIVLSRVLLRLHYVTDVLFGMVWGIGIGVSLRVLGSF